MADNKAERPLEERFETIDTSAKINNGDAALGFLNNTVVAEMSEEDEKRLVRKIDWMIIPLMCTRLPLPSPRAFPTIYRC
jgi:hypothetical protein